LKNLTDLMAGNINANIGKNLAASQRGDPISLLTPGEKRILGLI
jgi:hypothetical protein